MGYAIAIAPCIFCKVPFGFNPHTVPSTSAITGKREPFCESCLARVNEARKAQGQEPFVAPAGAYEPIEESQL